MELDLAAGTCSPTIKNQSYQRIPTPSTSPRAASVPTATRRSRALAEGFGVGRAERGHSEPGGKARALRSPPIREVVTALRLHVELIHDPGCPNVKAARELLTSVLREAGVAAVWTEWSTGDARCPEHARGFGSPTILVNGDDVAPGHPWEGRIGGQGACCRVYRHEDGELTGVPPRELLSAAIRGALEPDAG